MAVVWNTTEPSQGTPPWRVAEVVKRKVKPDETFLKKEVIRIDG